MCRSGNFPRRRQFRSTPGLRPRGPRGFTLVELLVVIGIIALLISILLPTLASARRSAANIKCLSNQRQLATATAFFINDHDGYVMKAWLNGRAQGTSINYGDNLSRPGGSSKSNWGYEPELWGWDYVLKGYCNGDNGVFACPSDSTGTLRGTGNNDGSGVWPAGEPDRTVDDIPASYRLNISNQKTDWNAYKITELREGASQAIVITDAADGFHQVESWDWNPVESGGLASFGLKKTALANLAPKRHSAADKMYRGDPLAANAVPIFKLNAAFADGHGASVNYDETFTPLGQAQPYAIINHFGQPTGQTAVGIVTQWRQIFRNNDQVDTYDNPLTDADDGNPFPG